MIKTKVQSLFQKVQKDTFFLNSFILFVASLLVGFINYCYQFIMARMLAVGEYGELQSLVALFSLVTVFGNALILISIKYTAEFSSTGNWNKVYSLLIFFLRKTFLFGAIGLSIFIFCIPIFARFLNLHSYLNLFFIGFALIFSFASSVTQGISRGLQKFKAVSIVSLLQVVVKLLFSVFFVWFGFAVNGAVGALLLSGIVGYIISFYPLRFLLKKQKEPLEGRKIFHYSFPVFFTLLATTALMSMDIILVKHFFSPEKAGEYAALALLGKIIFFVTGPIASVMFPLSAQAHASSLFPAKVLKKALYITVGISLPLLLSYFLFPDIIVKMLLGEKFFAIVPYIGWFGMALFFYSLISLFAQYFLSIGDNKSTIIVGFGSLLEFVVLFSFHDTLWHIVWGITLVMATILFLLGGYFWKLYYLCPKK